MVEVPLKYNDQVIGIAAVDEKTGHVVCKVDSNLMPDGLKTALDLTTSLSLDGVSVREAKLTAKDLLFGASLSFEPNKLLNIGGIPVMPGLEDELIYWRKATRVVRQYIDKREEKTDVPPDYMVYVVWFSKTLKNWKAMVSTTRPDGMYYEVTHNGQMGETYIDAYKKFENVCVPDDELSVPPKESARIEIRDLSLNPEPSIFPGGFVEAVNPSLDEDQIAGVNEYDAKTRDNRPDGV